MVLSLKKKDYELRQYMEMARRVAKRSRYGHLADDFAQEAALRLIEKGRPTNLKTAFIDFLRAEYGRTGLHSRPGERAKAAARHSQVSLDTPVNGEPNSSTYHDVIASPGRDPEPFGGNWRDRVSFRGRDAIVFELRYEYEMSEADIGKYIGFDQRTVSRILKSINKEIQSAAIREEVEAYYRDDPEYSKLEIEWIRL